ncbi:MAG: 4-hydroxy-tetrahydrodipicolinate reductase [Patescibacteria group bacterium]|nr:4-hydroxy-tetrahydrodipicolinate reductase [Patescibacteria group bacterium]
MSKIIVYGYRGKMGQALLDCCPGYQGIEVVGRVDLGDSLEKVLDQADVVVDFSSPAGTMDALEQCVGAGKAMVIGTTGHSEAEQARIVEGACVIPIVKASNFSTGVNVLFWLARETAELLGPGFDLEIVEAHHRLKKDAPSGTAKTLAEILTEVRDKQFAATDEVMGALPVRAVNGRSGNTGVRSSTEIGIHSIRGGDIVGEHTVIFAGNGERVELTHKASSRATFANGALRAAQWVVGKPAGLYSMTDVLGLPD